MMRARSQLAPPRLWLYVVAALMLPSLLAVFGIWLEGEYDRMRHTAALVDIVAQRRVRALELIGNLRKAETEQRGYVITRNPQFLAVYEPSRQAVRRDLEVVVRPNPVAPFADQRRTELRALIAAKFTEMDAVIAEVRRGQVASAVSRVAAGQGRALMGRIEQQLQAIIAADAALLAKGRARYQDRTQRSRQIVWALVVIVGALMLIGMVILWYSRRERWQVAIAQADASMRNQAVLDSTSDAIVILNPSGTIENVNAAARSVLGYEPAELSRRDLSVMLDIAGGEGSFHERIGLVDGKLRQTLFVDRFARTKDGRSIPVDVALGLMPVPDGLHVVASIRDISHRREVEQIKDDFIATVSHELRTPLTSVVGSLGLLRGGAAGTLPAGAQQLIDIAENNARRLIRLTNDILDLEKFGSGQMSLEREPTDMAVIMRQAADECQASARIKSIAIEANYPAETCLVSADHQRLLQVAGNLLSNAIRHTPERSTITICVALKAGMIETRICDQGPGVPAEYRKQIFERFVQAPAGGTVGGTGLGLAIAREIIHRHDGKIWIEEAPTGGACFAFALPCMRPGIGFDSPADLAVIDGDAPLSPECMAPTCPTVLQIDDDLDLVRVVAASLAGEARVIRANDLASARTVIEANPPDIVVLDIGLPDGSGLDIIPLLVDQAGRPIPIVVFSAQDGPPELNKRVEAVLVKSRSSLPMLGETIRRILTERAKD